MLQRFGQRVAQGLQLDVEQTRRLQRELQISRRERLRITVRTRELRRELNQLIQTSPADDGRIARLLDELMTLGLQAALDRQGVQTEVPPRGLLERDRR